MHISTVVQTEHAVSTNCLCIVHDIEYKFELYFDAASMRPPPLCVLGCVFYHERPRSGAAYNAVQLAYQPRATIGAFSNKEGHDGTHNNKGMVQRNRKETAIKVPTRTSWSTTSTHCGATAPSPSNHLQR